MRKSSVNWRANARRSRSIWGVLPKTTLDALQQLTQTLGLSVVTGDLQLLNGRWYVTHAGLLRIAHRRHCRGIRTFVQKELSDPSNNRWVCRAVVYRDSSTKGFVGYGDADPANVSPALRGSELRIAETRAVNRALRKAFGIGTCSVEELGWPSEPRRTEGRTTDTSDPATHSNGSNHAQPRLRDQLCLLIRRHNLDPALVKAYATDYLGTQTLSQASRERIESFISHLQAAAQENRDGLVRTLNSYAPHPETKS